MNQVAPKHSFRDVAIADHGGGGKLMPQSFGDVVEFSKIMAMSQHAIPRHLRDVPGACLAVTMQALRWEMDPFAVASKSYNVKDIIAYEAQLIAAIVHTRAPLKTRPNYEYSGEGTTRRCKVSAEFTDGVTRSYESPRVADIKTQNSPLWKADTDQQLGYYSIRAFARRYCPETILGVYTPEEAQEFVGPDNARDVTPRPSLQDRLAAGGAAGEGFSQQHVVSEIDGTNPDASQSHPQPPSSGDETPPATEQPPHAVAGTNTSAATDAAGQPDRTETVADSNEGGYHALASDTSQESEGSAATPEAVALPAGWAQSYIAALRRAVKKESLSKLAKQFWASVGVEWKAIKDTSDGALATRVYDAFTENFENKKALEEVLREFVA